MTDFSRRAFLSLLGAGTLSAFGRHSGTKKPPAPEFRIRTITAGLELDRVDNPDRIYEALAFLSEARDRLATNYEVQTIRIALQPVRRYTAFGPMPLPLDDIVELDRIATDAGCMLNLGPMITDDSNPSGFANAVSGLNASTENTHCSVFVASEAGIHRHTIRAAAEAILAIAAHSEGGEGNFRFCATAYCPPGTPFFPAAWHEGPRAFAIGLESPGILQAALEPGMSRLEAEQAMRIRLNNVLEPVEAIARQVEGDLGWRYRGIDTSPAPGLDTSIGAVIEKLSGAPFGSPATLAACSSITNVLQNLDVATHGYCGLMLPVLEDAVLARRAEEGRYSIDELLLYSSVCGTGLDVIPLAGSVTAEQIEAVIGDVAALAHRYRKPLSARLFPIPGKESGEAVDFENPFLTASRVMTID